MAGTLTQSLVTTLTPPLRLFSSLLTTRNLIILFALLNLKSLPLSWHIRLFSTLLANLRSFDTIRRPKPSSKTSSPSHPGGDNVHLIFTPHTLTTHAPLLETDYNLHKSNSTYFSDLDISRTALVTRLISHPISSKANALQRELESQGHTGRLNVILGSVHTSYRKEIVPYERYEVRSRVLGWDQKWLVIGSWFVRPAKGKRQEEVLASALSKYVFKKGRFTVAPERCLRNAGNLPERPTTTAAAAAEKDNVGDAALGESKWEDVAKGNADESLPQEGLTAASVLADLGKVVSHGSEKLATTIGDNTTVVPQPSPGSGKWTWERIDEERRRGLELAKAWMALDGELLDEYSRVPGTEMETAEEGCNGEAK